MKLFLSAQIVQIEGFCLVTSLMKVNLYFKTISWNMFEVFRSW
jgi:hypothetical protein